MKITVLDVDTLGDDLDLSVINSLGEVEVYNLTLQDEVIDRITESEVLILNKVKLNENNLPYAKKLKLICITATGFDNVDISYCSEHNIAVCNVVGYSTESVVQLTMSMAFALCTNLMSFNNYVHSGDYTKSGIFNHLKPVFNEMFGKTWGVVGLGNIGVKVARMARELGCNVLAYKRNPVDEFECCDIDTLCKKSDIITLHTPLNEQTMHLINEKRLSYMKDGVVLVNVARGAVVDEEAVVKAVESGKIGGLGVDVYSTEPMLADSPYQRILGRENVILTPHMA
ncbi:MAG: hydroxyacid dehydrogenase, partial [Clostridia bacterium]|nr:hydroxyacid dehydrogenase [Clostridia bacterium]